MKSKRLFTGFFLLACQGYKILRVRPRDYQTVIHSLSTFKTEENSESESQSLRLHPENESLLQEFSFTGPNHGHFLLIIWNL